MITTQQHARSESLQHLSSGLVSVMPRVRHFFGYPEAVETSAKKLDLWTLDGDLYLLQGNTNKAHRSLINARGPACN